MIDIIISLCLITLNIIAYVNSKSKYKWLNMFAIGLLSSVVIYETIKLIFNGRI